MKHNRKGIISTFELVAKHWASSPVGVQFSWVQFNWLWLLHLSLSLLNTVTRWGCQFGYSGIRIIILQYKLPKHVLNCFLLYIVNYFSNQVGLVVTSINNSWNELSDINNFGGTAMMSWFSLQIDYWFTCQAFVVSLFFNTCLHENQPMLGKCKHVS